MKELAHGCLINDYRIKQSWIEMVGNRRGNSQLLGSLGDKKIWAASTVSPVFESICPALMNAQLRFCIHDSSRSCSLLLDNSPSYSVTSLL